MKHINRLFATIFSIVLAILFCTNSINGIEVTSSEMAVSQKISGDLKRIIANSNDDDLIPIYIFRKMIPEEDIHEMLLSETGIDSLIYTDEELFNDIIVPQVEGRMTFANNEFSRQTLQLELANEMNRYINAERNIIRREYELQNKSFINACSIESNKVIYCGQYTSTIIIEATPKDILRIASLSDVENVSYFNDYKQDSELNIALSQINADRETGTKSSRYNSGSGFTGVGVIIGVIEANEGMYDSTAPQLTGIPSSKLTYISNYHTDGSEIIPTVNDHATKVVSIIMGKSKSSSDGYFYEGVAPDATVYQTSVTYTSDVYNAINLLASKGVHIINYSGGVATSGYDKYDEEIDRMLNCLKITFVKSAGNTSGEISSPGKALNAITVGNLETKSGGKTALSAPFSIYASSSYYEDYYLPNKPDLVAPGTYISTWKPNNIITSGTGTSYSAPIITGVIAQLMQRTPSLMNNPYRTKSLIVSFSSNSSVSSTNNPTTDLNGLLRDKSGAGMIDAQQFIKGFSHANYVIKLNGSSYSYNTASYESGQRIRVVLAFFKSNTLPITSASNMDNLDLRIKDSNGNIVATSASSRNNIEIIEYTIPSDGIYTIEIYATNVQDSSLGVPYGISWRVIS